MTNTIPNTPNKKGPTSRQLKAAASKQKIYDSAKKLFEKYGYDNVSVASICDDAGVSIGLFYNYYKSKADIPIESFQVMEQNLSDTVASFSSSDSSLQRFVKIAHTLLYVCIKSESDLQNARIAYECEARGTVPNIFSSSSSVLRSILNDIIEYGKENGEIIPDADVSTMKRIFFNYIIGSTIHILNAADKETSLKKNLSDVQLIMKQFYIY